MFLYLALSIAICITQGIVTLKAGPVKSGIVKIAEIAQPIGPANTAIPLTNAALPANASPLPSIAFATEFATITDN